MSDYSFSYSRFNMFNACPRKYYHTYVEHGEPRRPLPTEIMVAGADRHAHIAESIRRGFYEDLPARSQNIFEAKISEGWEVLVEHEFYAPTPSGSFKAIVDVALLSPQKDAAIIIDWKSSNYPQDDTQLLYYAVAVSSTYKTIQSVKAMFVLYDRDAFPAVYEFGLEDLQKAYRQLRAATERLANAGESIDGYPQRPGLACNHCPFSKKCLGDYYELPFADMDMEELVKAYYIASEFADQCKEQIKNLMLDNMMDSVLFSGIGFKVVRTEYLREYKKNSK